MRPVLFVVILIVKAALETEFENVRIGACSYFKKSSPVT